MKYLIIAISMLMASSAFARVCVNKRRIDGYTVNSPTSIMFEVDREYYEFTVMYCPEAESTFHVLGFDTFSSFQVCEGDDVLVVDRYDLRILNRCMIQKITKHAQTKPTR